MSLISRTAWKFDDTDRNIESLRRRGNLNEDGYINVAEQFGLSGERGMNPSLYSPLTGPWLLGYAVLTLECVIRLFRVLAFLNCPFIILLWAAS